jgi:hypothetical protein
MVSINTLLDKSSRFRVNSWIMDSGAFTQILRHKKFDIPSKAYAREIERWNELTYGRLAGAVCQDWICEPVIRQITGKTVHEHQELTVESFIELKKHVRGVQLIPVIQGYKSHEYVNHIRMYGELLTRGMWVAVGSVCRRNGDTVQIRRILEAIIAERPDLKLHGFGLKVKSLQDEKIRDMLYTSDSMAWSDLSRCKSWEAFARDKNCEDAKDQHDPRDALRYAWQIQKLCDPEELETWWTYPNGAPRMSRK